MMLSRALKAEIREKMSDQKHNIREYTAGWDRKTGKVKDLEALDAIIYSDLKASFKREVAAANLKKPGWMGYPDLAGKICLYPELLDRSAGLEIMENMSGKSQEQHGSSASAELAFVLAEIMEGYLEPHHKRLKKRLSAIRKALLKR